jgi:hypothetical protein
MENIVLSEKVGAPWMLDSRNKLIELQTNGKKKLIRIYNLINFV